MCVYMHVYMCAYMCGMTRVESRQLFRSWFFPSVLILGRNSAILSAPGQLSCKLWGNSSVWPPISLQES